MSIGLNNNFEAKVRNDKDSTSNELKKVVLLNNFNISTAHNFAADSLDGLLLEWDQDFHF